MMRKARVSLISLDLGGIRWPTRSTLALWGRRDEWTVGTITRTNLAGGGIAGLPQNGQDDLARRSDTGS